MKKEYVDKNGYKRGDPKHSDLIHRQIAYKEIYLKRKEEFPKPFSFYQVHHIDNNKQNNDVSNLMLLSKEDHEKIHQIYPNDPLKELKIKQGLSDWEIKKAKSNLAGDFSQIRIILIAAVIIIGAIFLLFNYLVNQKSPINNDIPVKVSPVTVSANKYSIYIKNNMDKEITLDINYRRYSEWFGVDEITNLIINVKPNEEVVVDDPQFSNNIGCDGIGPCNINIIDYEII